jgi:hypothetical protein
LLHPLSLIIPLLILLPNLLFFRLPPQNMPSGTNSSKVLSAAEGIGRAGTMAGPLFYAMQFHGGYEVASLIVMVVCLTAYYAGWTRYFTGKREYRLLFTPLSGIPVPMAVGPALYLLLSSIILHSVSMALFGVVFAVSHVWNSLRACEALRE